MIVKPVERTRTLSVEEFAKEKGPKDAHVRHAFTAEVRVEGEDKKGPITFVISTGEIDRYNSTINQGGWRLENFKKNPVVCWAHNSWAPPIARSTRQWIEDDKLHATVDFTRPQDQALKDADLFKFAAAIEDMVRGGFLNAASVGWDPVVWQYNEERGGVDFLENELLEFSIVTVPGNANALVEARSAGIDVGPVLHHYEQALRTMRGPGRYVTDAEVAEALRLSTTRTVAAAEATQADLMKLIADGVERAGKELSRR